MRLARSGRAHRSSPPDGRGHQATRQRSLRARDPPTPAGHRRVARRDSWIEAGDGALALASSLLKRGRVRDAQDALEDARQFASRCGRAEVLVDVAVLTGEAWIDRARLDDAESVLGAALPAARATGDALRLANASLALARCGFWRGRYADAATALPVATTDWPAELRLGQAVLAARIAVGQREPGRAMASVSEALELSSAGHNPSMIAAASCAAAFVHLSVGDLGAVDRDVASSISAARSAHDPLRAIRARLLLAEAERRRKRASNALGIFSGSFAPPRTSPRHFTPNAP